MITSECVESAEAPPKRVPLPPVVSSLRSLAIRGSIWTIFGYGSSQVLRLISNLILSRLLFPEAFGLSALVGILMQGMQMFSDVGIGPNIIRSTRGDDQAFLDTAWTVQAARGLTLWVCSALLAGPISRIYEMPELVWLLPAVGATAAIQGFNSTALFTCNRRLLVGRLMILEFTVQLTTLAGMVSLALIHRSVWALILGGLLGSTVRMILSYRLLPGPRNHLRWESEARRELFSFGRWIFLSTLITFVSMQIDRVVLAKLVPMREFGIYTIAVTLAQIPRDVIQRLSDLIVFPAVSRIIHEPSGFRKVGMARRYLLLISTPISILLIVWAPWIVRFLYDPRYAAASGILRLLAIGTWIQTVQVTYGLVVLAAGRPSYISVGFLLRLTIFLTLIVPCFRRFGMEGMAGVMAISEVGVLISCMYGAYRVEGAAPRQAS